MEGKCVLFSCWLEFKAEMLWKSGFTRVSHTARSGDVAGVQWVAVGELGCWTAKHHLDRFHNVRIGCLHVDHRIERSKRL